MGMTEQERFEAWLAKVCERPLPKSEMERIRTFAREMADGATKNFWDPFFLAARSGMEGTSNRFKEYISAKWDDAVVPTSLILQTNGYLQDTGRGNVRLTPSAFHLIEEIEPAAIFISYSRKQSSAFALLIHTWLNKDGYTAFLDKELNAGVQWRADLQKRIESCNFLVAIFGENTFPSTNIVDELSWAFEAGVRIIPIWHEGYDFRTARPHLPDGIFAALDELNAVRILEENPLQYEAAILALINRFGVTPE